MMKRFFDILLKGAGFFFSMTVIGLVIAAVVMLRFYLLIMAFMYAVLGLICIDNIKEMREIYNKDNLQ